MLRIFQVFVAILVTIFATLPIARAQESRHEATLGITKDIQKKPVDFHFPQTGMMLRVLDIHREGQCEPVIILYRMLSGDTGELVFETNLTLAPGQEIQFNVFGGRRTTPHETVHGIFPLLLTCEPGTEGNSVLTARLPNDGNVEVK